MPFLRIHTYRSAKKLHHLVRYGQSESHALAPLSTRQACKCLEYALLLVGSHAYAGVSHAENKTAAREPRCHTDTSFVGVLQRIAQKIIYDLPYMEGIGTTYHIMHLRRHEAVEVQPTLRSKRLHAFHTLDKE